MNDRATAMPGSTGPTIPSPPSGHGLLDGKVVVITAAAGTGIGLSLIHI